MESVNELFLQALRASLESRTVDWKAELTSEQWQRLFAVASAHRVLPMIYDAVSRCPSAQKTDRQVFMTVKRQVMQQVMLQAVRTDAFLKLMRALTSAGVTPLVVKGIVCRQLYPNPDYRMSGDEDVLIPESQFALSHEIMLANGMETTDPVWNLDAHEIHYNQKQGPLRIDLHKRLFPTDGEAYAKINSFFEGVHQRAIVQNFQDVAFFTMDHTEHLFFLLCHSFKHFLLSGFGIRQVCDVCLYANTFGDQIDWLRIRKQCEEMHADLFAIALFRIGEKYLTFQPDVACYPETWKTLEVDESALLEDLLEAGVYGKSSTSRIYSRHLTMQAFSNQKKGNRGGFGILKSVFPSAKYLSGRYSYLKEKPYLLPVAWVDRIVKYSRETVASGQGNSAAESLRIGNERIELLKQYGVIER